MKKKYIVPAMKVVAMQTAQLLEASAKVMIFDDSIEIEDYLNLR